VLDESIAAFHAEGGAVYLTPGAGHSQPQLPRSEGERQGGSPDVVPLEAVHTSQGWSETDAEVSAPLECDGEPFGRLSLGVRRHGGEYTKRDREVLRQTAELLARTIRLATR
jgi:GAF domain-containing protein